MPSKPNSLRETRWTWGECVAQYLSLALDPYPRLSGAQLPPEVTGNTDAGAGKAETLGDGDGGGTASEDSSQGPFSALQALKNRN